MTDFLITKKNFGFFKGKASWMTSDGVLPLSLECETGTSKLTDFSHSLSWEFTNPEQEFAKFEQDLAKPCRC